MARASYVQTNFLGGEWSPHMQGRMEREDYRTAMNVCLNGLPVAEGSWVRRSGSRLLAPTRGGVAAAIWSFGFSSAQPYLLEFTPLHLRFFEGGGLVLESISTVVAAISAGTPAKVQTAFPHGWSTSDQVMFRLDTGSLGLGVHRLLNRQFVITVTSTTSFTLADAVTGASIAGSQLAMGSDSLFVGRVLDETTVYTAAQLPDLRVVQDQLGMFVLHHDVKPYSLEASTQPTETTPGSFTWGASVFRDGPYLDPYKDGSTVTPSGLSGSITLTASIGSGPDLPAFPGFASTDVGRFVRLFSEPLDWSSGTTYAAGDQVKYAGAYYSALKANTGKKPDLDVANWAIDVEAAIWTWGTISAVADSTHCTVAIEPLVQGEDNVASGPLLYTHAIKTWRLGLFSATSGYPSCGAYHEGRLWLAGAQANRFDSSVSNQHLNFAPTGRDGTVADNSAISYTFNAAIVNDILWMRSDDQGLLAGSRDAEWLIRASAQNDPLTPTSIQAKPTTFNGSKAIDPVRTANSLCFVQKHGRKVMEYVANPQPGKFSATDLSLSAKHLTVAGIAEIAYQHELNPIIWARLDDGGLIGCTYRRDDPYGTQPLTFSGWHRHTLGSGRTVEGLQGGPSPDGEVNTIFLVTNDADTNIRFVEVLTNIMETDAPITDGFFVDCAAPPVAATFSGTSLILYGYLNLVGESLAAMIGGVDMGDFTVAADGSLTIPNALTSGLFTQAYLDTLTAAGDVYGSLGVLGRVAAPGAAPTAVLTGLFRHRDDLSVLGVTSTINSSSFAADWANNRAFMINTGDASDDNNGIYVFDVRDGTLLDEVSVTTLTVALPAAGSVFVFYDGFLYFPSGTSNQAPLQKVNATTLAHVSTFGAVDSGVTTTSTRFAYPYSMAGFSYGTTDYLASCSLGPGTVYVDIMTTATLGWSGHSALIGESKGHVCAGPAGRGIAYVLGGPHYDTISTDDITLYRASYNGVTFELATIGALTYTDIDATWTGFYRVDGLIFDETDGHVICFISDSTGASGYVVKLNTGDGTVVWKVAVNSIGDNISRNAARISGGTLLHFSAAGGASSTVYTINTSAGTATNATVPGAPAGQGYYDSRTTHLVCFGNYVQSTPGAPVGPAVADFSNRWFGLCAAYADPPGPAYPAPATPGTTFFAPFAVGFTFTSDGQMLRPIAPSETGAQNGPALAKTRRTHMFGALLYNTQGISFGTTFSNLRPAQFRTPSGTDYTALQLWSGLHQDTIEDDNSFDSMVAWRITRPYPATVLAVEPFLQTQDR